MNISLIIFCFNEAANIGSVIRSSVSKMEQLAADYEILVIEDGSTDGTAEACADLIKIHPKVRLIRHSRNLGIGMAIRTGYLEANMEYVCAIPGDGQFDLNELDAVDPFSNSTYYAFYRQRTGYNTYRSLLTWLNRIFNHHVLGVFLRDVNWIKIYRKEQLEMVAPELKSSLIESEISAKLYKCGITPIEIPSKYLPRNSGIAKGGNWKTLRKAISELWQLWWTVQRFKPSHRF